jgi:FKBP-type peptidyl-prolyl cis-trans isomerase
VRIAAVVLFYPPLRLAENSEPKEPAVKLKMLVSATAVALLAACSGDATGPDIPVLTPLPAGVTIVTTESGLQYADITVGTGTLAQDGSSVAVHYTGWLADGTGFDTSRGLQPLPFTIGQHQLQVAGFEEGVLGMRVGGKRRLFVPAELAYGATAVYDQGGRLVIPANSDLIFDVELVSVQ